jgi:steroid delta-isomerase-like uncharacterized protein
MATAPVTNALTETEERNLKAVSDVLQFWNTHDVEGILTFYDDEIVWVNMGLEESYEGKQAVRDFLNRLMSAIPDLVFTVTHKIARGDNVSEQWNIKGTHLGTFLGIPPTGRPIVIEALSMVRLRDGKFLRDEFYWDTRKVMNQMGLMPSLAATQSSIGRGVLWAAVKTGNVLTPSGRRARSARRARPS